MEKDELTCKVIGCAMKVHNTLGNGLINFAATGLIFNPIYNSENPKMQ